jgi:hypothetical protein
LPHRPVFHSRSPREHKGASHAIPLQLRDCSRRPTVGDGPPSPRNRHRPLWRFGPKRNCVTDTILFFQRLRLSRASIGDSATEASMPTCSCRARFPGRSSGHEGSTTIARGRTAPLRTNPRGSCFRSTTGRRRNSRFSTSTRYRTWGEGYRCRQEKAFCMDIRSVLRPNEP